MIRPISLWLSLLSCAAFAQVIDVGDAQVTTPTGKDKDKRAKAVPAPAKTAAKPKTDAKAKAEPKGKAKDAKGKGKEAVAPAPVDDLKRPSLKPEELAADKPAADAGAADAKKPADAKPAEPAKAADAKGDPKKPADAKPAEPPKATDAKVDPKKPADAKPAEPAKAADAKGDPKKPAEPAKADAKPTDVKPVEAKPADAKPAETKPEPPRSADAAPDYGLDLTTAGTVNSVLVAPPIVRVTSSMGGFAGLNTTKVSERFDAAGHKRIVPAFQKLLEGKVLPAESSLAAITKEGLTAATLRTTASLAKLAAATHVEWLVILEVNKTGALVGTVFSADGKAQGQPAYVTGATALTQKNADDIASFVVRQLVDLAGAKKPVVAAAPVIEVGPPPPEEDFAEAEVVKAPVKKEWKPDPTRVRMAASVGPGGATRTLALSGDAADSLAALRNGTVLGLGVYGQFAPLQLFDGTANRAWSDFEIEVNFRRAFVRATGVAGAVEGQKCSMTDDDVQVRGTWRYKLGGGYLPSVGVGGGWSQERTWFACDLPLLSTTWRGADVQLRVRQPVFRDLVALDVAVGPRFLVGGGGTSRSGLSIAGEAWLEVKPWSVLFARGGARVSRLSANSDAGLTVVDTRIFFAAELGAFF